MGVDGTLVFFLLICVSHIYYVIGIYSDLTLFFFKGLWIHRHVCVHWGCCCTIFKNNWKDVRPKLFLRTYFNHCVTTATEVKHISYSLICFLINGVTSVKTDRPWYKNVSQRVIAVGNSFERSP